MNTIKIDKNEVRLVAHRGLSGIETENTASAFVAAGNRSYYGIETDIYRTKDGKFAISHDPSLMRMAGREMNIEEHTLAELQSVTLLDKSGTKCRPDLIVPTLENYLLICKKYEKQAILELKSDFTEEEIARIIEIIDSFAYLPKTTFISFKYTNLEKIRAILPTHSAQFLFSEFTDEITENLIRDRIDVDVRHTALTKEIIDKFHEAGLLVNCWTVDGKVRAEELIAWGVDLITTNILE